MNDVFPPAIEAPPVASGGGRLDKLLRLSNVVGVVTIIPAFFYP